MQAQNAAEQSAKASLAMAQSQYTTGAVNYATVLNALQTYQTAVISRVKAQAARYTDTVALYQSLGGGWWNRSDETDKAYPRKNAGHFAGPDSVGMQGAKTQAETSSVSQKKKDL